MLKKFQIAPVLVVGILTAGCIGPGALDLAAIFQTDLSVPVASSGTSSYEGLRVGYNSAIVTAGGEFLLSGDSSSELLFVADTSVDIGLFLQATGGEGFLTHRSPRVWVSFKPGLGFWAWSVGSDGFGFQTSLRMGLVYDFSPERHWDSFAERMLRIEYGWLTLHGVEGSDDARMQVVEIGYAFTF